MKQRLLRISTAARNESSQLECPGNKDLTTFATLRNLINRFHYQILFFCETKSNWAKINTIKRQIQFHGIHVVNNMGYSSGLTLLWKEDVNVKTIGSSKFFIDAIINPDSENAWRFTGYYKDPDPSQRIQSWRLLRRLKDGSNLLWLVGGDMNEILYNMEKKGGPPRSATTMLQFHFTRFGIQWI